MSVGDTNEKEIDHAVSLDVQAIVVLFPIPKYDFSMNQWEQYDGRLWIDLEYYLLL